MRTVEWFARKITRKMDCDIRIGSHALQVNFLAKARKCTFHLLRSIVEDRLASRRTTKLLLQSVYERIRQVRSG